MDWPTTVAGCAYACRDDVIAGVADLDRAHGGRFDAAARAEWNALNAVLDDDERDRRRARLAELARSGVGEPGADNGRDRRPAAGSMDRATAAVIDGMIRAGELAHEAAAGWTARCAPTTRVG